MTSLSPDDTARSFDVPARAAFEITWSATRVGDRGSITSRLTVQFRLVDDAHVVVHAWTEHDGTTTTLLDHVPLPCTVHRDGTDRLHLDVRDADAAITTPIAALSLHGDHLLYARTSLLTRTGYASASWDPPQLQRLRAADVRQRA